MAENLRSRVSFWTSTAAATSDAKPSESESQQRQRRWLGNARWPIAEALIKATAVRDILTTGTCHDATRAKTGDGVLNQSHLCRGRQKSTTSKRQIAVTADEVMREDVSGERRAIEGRGAADSPIDPDI